VALLAVAALVAVPSLLLARAARADVVREAASVEEETFRVILSRAGATGRMELRAGPYPQVEDGRVFLQVMVSANRPRASFLLEPRDAHGRAIRRCSFEPGDYRVERHTQTTVLACPVPDSSAVRGLVVEAVTPIAAAALHVSRRDDGRYEGGGLLEGQARGVGPALDRLSADRSRLFRAPTLLLSLGLSTSLLVAGLAVAIGADHRRAD
jgi:hypothetical protein